jgi:cytochrome d ubiquinol oxidase subunit I
MSLGTITALLQPISGDFNGRKVAQYQPIKLAAMEALFETQGGAPLIIGGIPDEATGNVHYRIEIPYGLSLLAFHDPHAVIKGLNEVPRDERPNVLWVHVAYQVMVGCGLVLAALGLWFAWVRWRWGVVESKWLLRALVCGAPLGFAALEAGWIVTELGRQPWTIYGLMRTSEAVTPVSDVPSSLLVFTVLYLGLGLALIVLLLRLRREALARDDVQVVSEAETDHVA